jgi:hypothetical protein
MALAFAANRDIKIEAAETSAGLYTLRTRGLDGRRRPELEIAGVPEVALNGAGGVINLLADHSVNLAEILAEQTVGNLLAAAGPRGGRKLLLVVRAVSVEKPKGGLWSKLAGGGKGVLRLVDIDRGSVTPLAALATMLVHRAALRRAKDDLEGARSELEAAIATFPGSAATGAAPEIEGVGGTFNAQNHIAYLDLAALARDADDEAACERRFAEAALRSQELAQRVRDGASRDDLLATYAV